MGRGAPSTVSESTAAVATASRVRDLVRLGQSPWLDQLRREWLTGTTLTEWIESVGIRGLTSNPSIFQTALATSDAYDDELAALARAGLDARQIYDRLTLEDIRAACDAFLPLWRQSGGADGYVSHEVGPELAHDTWATLREARRLWQAVARPNVMIKMPATPASLPAIERALAEGINVNVTLIFSLKQYLAVADAHLRALETRAAQGGDLGGLASVASFFVSRVDTKVDALLDARLASPNIGLKDKARAGELRGRAAVANAVLGYEHFIRRLESHRFAALAIQGARPQRLLWASTSTKDPTYVDTKYVDEMVLPYTVNTLPLDTLERFRDHGRAACVIPDYNDAISVTAKLAAMAIDLEAVGDELLRAGVVAFSQSSEHGVHLVESKRRDLAPTSRPV